MPSWLLKFHLWFSRMMAPEFAAQVDQVIKEMEMNKIDKEQIPRCNKLDGSELKIVPAYTEAGRYCEANCITVTDGERTAIYTPVRVMA